MPNGVDAELFRPGADDGLRERLGIGDDAPVAAFVATLDRAHHFKRVDVAIDALARLGDERVHLVVAGGGELLDGFRGPARAAGVAERVHFLGAVPHAELPGVLRAADLFLLTTEPPESFGIVLIEAMACGLPAIATDYPGVRAVVDEGETGLVVREGIRPRSPPRSRSSPAGPERRAAMGERGRSRAVAEWSWPRLVDRMDGAYVDAIAVRRARWGVTRRRVLLVAYFYPPCRDTGVLRAAAMAKWLRRGGHDVTVLTTSAYGADRDDTARTSCAPPTPSGGAPGCRQGPIDAMFDSATYSGGRTR